MAIVCCYSRLILFITFTANLWWDKIIYKLLLSQTANDCFDLITYIFYIKVVYLLNNLKKKQIFSKFLGCIQTIKYQKQGLLYLYFFFFLYPQDYNILIDLIVVNCYISAELLWPSYNPTRQFIDIMRTIIVYKPYSTANPNAPYIVVSALGHLLIYLKWFLKLFCPTIVVYKDGYPQYQHCDDLQLWPVCILGCNSVTINLNNRQVVLYNLYFSIKYYAYINIKVCAFVQAIKYINKYIYKGDNCTTIQLLDNNNKINKYFYGRYISPTKAIQRLFKFCVYKEYPFIKYFAVYLFSQQPVYFQLNKFVEDL